MWHILHFFFFRSILQENPRGPASRGDRLFSFQTFCLSGEVIVSLHNRRFMSQARRTRHFARSVGRLRSFIPHLHISHNAPYLPPKILHKHFFQISLGTAVIPRSNRLLEMKNKGYTQFWGQIRCFMGDV